VGVLLDSLHSALALGPGAQDHLLQARQMQALSFTAHIRRHGAPVLVLALGRRRDPPRDRVACHGMSLDL
jgi:hypothetical protein